MGLNMHEAPPTYQRANSEEPGWPSLSAASGRRRRGITLRGEPLPLSAAQESLPKVARITRTNQSPEELLCPPAGAPVFLLGHLQ